MKKKNHELDAFKRRALAEGNFAEYKAVVELDEKQRAAAGESTSISPLAWLVLGLVVVGVAWSLLVYLFSTWYTTTATLAVVFVVVYLKAGGRLPRGRTVQRRRPAPIVVPPTGKAVDMLGTGLPTPEARAVFDSLTGSKQKLYRQALAVEQVAPPGRTSGEGHDLVVIPVPGGQITAKDIDLTRFAAALGVEITQVSIHRRSLPSAVGVVVLHEDPATLSPPPWPALTGPRSWTSPMPLGIDEHGQPVEVDFAASRVLVAGRSGSGKSVFMRMLALWAAADPRTTVHLIDMKIDLGLAGLQDVVDSFHNGSADNVLKLRLERLRDELRDRYARMAETKRAPEDHIVVFIDEVQDVFNQLADAEEFLDEIARKGRAANVSLVLGSQTPDKKSIPRQITDQADVRIAFNMSGDWAAQIVLGDAKVDLTRLPAGHVILSDRGTMKRVATHYVRDEEAAVMVGEIVRERGSTAPSDMLVLAEDTEPDLLDEALDAIGERAGITWETLGYRLDMDAGVLREEFKALGIVSGVVRDPESKRSVRGLRRDDVRRVIEARNQA